MTKKLIVFGNGLGMALDAKHFRLTNAMKRVWDSDKLNTLEKATIGSLQGIEPNTGPLSEPDLLSTQIALNFLSSFRGTLGEDALATWFKEEALQFPETLRKYIFYVAHELYSYTIPDDRTEAWQTFLEGFVTFIKDTRSHVATLNYDDLIYEPIVSGILIEGNNFKLTRPDPTTGVPAPFLRDGFMNRNYSPDSYSLRGDCGYYMHLHGTPLFATKDDESTKLPRSSVAYTLETQQRHIVLANHDDKRTIIESSPILKDYWEKRLPKAIKDANEIILFGYGGEDVHLNELILERHAGSLRIIEWIEEGTLSDRENYWRGKFSPAGSEDVIETEEQGSEQLSLDVVQLKDILTFTDW